jgi:ATP-binding cassette subfamily C protein CydC
MRIWRELNPFVKLWRQHWKRMLLGMLLGMLTLLSGVGLLALSGWFISATAFAGLTLVSAQLFNFFYPGIGIRGFAITRTLARYAERIINHDATFRILESLRVWFYNHLEPLMPGGLAAYRSGDMLSRMVGDIDALDNLYLRVFSPSLTAFALSLAVTGFLTYFSPLAAGGMLAIYWLTGFGVPILALVWGNTASRQLTLCSAQLRTRCIDTLQGLPELLVFGVLNRQLQVLQEDHTALVSHQRRMNQIRGISSALVLLFSGGAVLLVLYVGVDLVEQQTLNGANLALMALAALAAFEAVMPLPAAFQYLGQTREASRRLTEIVAAPPAVVFPSQSSAKPANADVKLEQVSFRYHPGGSLVLQSLDLDIPQGQRLAVLGQTGVGKSTLAHLLVRFWQPSSGRILTGGRPIESLCESDLRHTITLISQHAHLFSGTIRDNLLLAAPDASAADLQRALEAAQLSSFVSELPEGLNTWVGESGKRLSGGQARRMAIARAVLHDAPIWILDEPTEGLDEPTAQNVMQAVLRLTVSRTVLLITHRLIGLEQMDQIAIMDNGRILEKGSHTALMSRETRYAELQAKIR